jgi:HEAT repeat protein
MTDAQRKAYWQFALKKIPEGELFAAFECNFREAPSETVRVLQQARAECSAEDVEIALALIFRYEPSADYVPLLCELLLADFHTRHEDIILALQHAAAPYSIPYLKEAVLLKPRLEYLAYDDYGAYSKKCFWALRAIGTPEAIAVIREFTSSEDLVAREQALYRLSKLEKTFADLSSRSTERVYSARSFS